ncbi:hypothetical protein PRIPAC_94907 [Pristionchus pacificus]|uniref:Amino acid transporter n=1 Tax=Pristionchus pacificus TaxID=54126 RepID=A0A2A6CQJ7_PRIPA|nr:hypothetical protein PRIPAC_94907 [Pristionchus pacificus]|eukprot:PDM80485.1 Amino acid transporter [Pristionchus pacificus]
MSSRENERRSYHEDSVEHEHYEGSHPIGDTVSHASLDISETRPIFHTRGVSGEESLSAETAFIHMVKAMLGTGLLSLPLAFKHSGLFLGLILIVIICIVCLHCMRQVVHAAHFVCSRNGRDLIDYANIMRGAVELGPEWLRHKGYFFKQLVNVNMFVSQLGFCCVYLVFMADNLEDFFTTHTSIHLSKGVWMILILIPLLGLCSIRRLPVLAPLCMAANVVYICAVAIVLFFFVSNLRPVNSLPWFGSIYDLPLFFGTVMFAFEGVAVVMPIENRMREPSAFIAWNGVLNSSCLFVLAIFAVTGFYGYLSLGDTVKDTATLNLPDTTVEKWITRKIAVENQTKLVYAVRFGGVFFTLAIAELIPHLALFISLIGAFSGASMALVFPPFIELLVSNAKGELSTFIICKNVFLLCFALLGFTTGTYAAVSEILKTFSS